MSARLPAVLYLHGFNSSPDSLKARQFKDYFQSRKLAEVLVPTLPHDPAQAWLLLQQIMGDPATRPQLVTGSSLGGFYATCLVEQFATRAVLINPAVAPCNNLSEKFLGKQRNLYTGEVYEFTRTHAAVLQELTVRQIKDPSLYLLLLQAGDAILDYRHAVALYKDSRQIVQEGGSHAFDNFAAMLPLVSSFAGLE
jgi:uncharacterized protein